MTKIIYIANSRIPTEKANGFQVMKMCEAFSNAGIEVELWLPGRFNPIKESPFAYYNIRETFKIRKYFVIDLIPFSKYLGRLANFVESVSFAIAVRLALPAAEFNLLYSRDQFTLWLLSFFKYPFIYEIHSIPRRTGLHGRIWRGAIKVVVITNGIKNILIKKGIDDSKIIVAPDAVDLGVFNAVNKSKEELRSELGLFGDNFLVGYVGRFKTLGMEKGIATMIESLPILDKDVKMIFVGGEEQEIKEYKTFAGRFNVLSQCVFISYQPYSKIIKYTKAMDAVVIPFPNKPHYAFYASPLKLFEYMASGRPIIASDLPALREILNDKNALFFKPEDAADLARAIKMLKNSKMLGLHLSQQALADVKEYTWDNRAKNILNFIEQ
ncbi:MAG: glycosyltransferase family 4 protein [Parcubacteria group bacterium]|nr:glycosyltransferase family 4 protein [Parcubacteria group bacterium]